LEAHPVNQQNSLLKLLFFTVASSSIVQIEPAPYEFLMILILFFAFYYHFSSFQLTHYWPFMFLLLFLLTNFISGLFIGDLSKGIHFLLITLYLAISWMGISGISNHIGVKLLPFVFKGYFIAAMISVLCGLLAYIGWAPFLEGIVLYGDRDRILGFFKDPNVFGPFLIPPALYSLWKVSRLGLLQKRGLFYFVAFSLLTFGLLLSFSRAAWGHYFISFIIYFFLAKKGTMKRLKLTLMLLLITTPVIIYFVSSTTIGDLFYDRLGLQTYDNDRFQNQANALDHLVHYPLGFGPGQSEVFLDFSTHSLYIRLLFENGIFGFISFLLFYLLCLVRAFKLLLISQEVNQVYFVIIFASLIGILFNSIFIDTMHWRHVWLLLALPFVKLEKKKIYSMGESV